MKTKFIIFIAALLFTTSAHALTLTEVVATVKARHPMILQGQAKVKKIAGMKRAESFLENPTVGVMYEQVPMSNFSLGNADMTTYSVTQEIPNPVSLTQKIKGFGSEKKAAQHMVTSLTREAEFEAKKTYFELYSYQRLKAAKQRSVNYYDQLIANLQRVYQSGDGMTTTGAAGSMGGQTTTQPSTTAGLDDVLMAKMKRAEVSAELFDMEHQVNALTAKLNLLMGRDALDKVGTLTRPKLKALKLNARDLEEKFATQNSDLAALNAMIKKSEHDITKTKADFFPSVMTNFEYNQRQNMDNAYTVGLELKIPLWVTNNIGSVDAAKAKALETRYKKQLTEQNLREELHYLIQHAKEHYKIVTTYQSQVLPLSEAAITAGLSSYQGGVASVTSVFQKIISYHEANSMYWRMWSDYNVEFAMLENLIGEEL